MMIKKKSSQLSDDPIQLIFMSVESCIQQK